MTQGRACRTATINEEYRSAYHGGHKNGQRAACASAQPKLPGCGETGGESGGTMLNVSGVNSFWYLRNFHDRFLFAFHACGLRVVDVMTLQWSNIDFNPLYDLQADGTRRCPNHPDLQLCVKGVTLTIF